ncbi:MAG: hypothetical protein P1V36_06565 [Planctomycetota bacterium]|nr:hypothetical protein [Planctomycetota bacterium]
MRIVPGGAAGQVEGLLLVVAGDLVLVREGGELAEGGVHVPERDERRGVHALGRAPFREGRQRAHMPSCLVRAGEIHVDARQIEVRGQQHGLSRPRLSRPPGEGLDALLRAHVGGQGGLPVFRLPLDVPQGALVRDALPEDRRIIRRGGFRAGQGGIGSLQGRACLVVLPDDMPLIGERDLGCGQRLAKARLGRLGRVRALEVGYRAFEPLHTRREFAEVRPAGTAADVGHGQLGGTQGVGDLGIVRGALDRGQPSGEFLELRGHEVAGAACPHDPAELMIEVVRDHRHEACTLVQEGACARLLALGALARLRLARGEHADGNERADECHQDAEGRRCSPPVASGIHAQLVAHARRAGEDRLARDEAVDVIGQGRGTGVTLRWVFRERLAQDQLHVAREVAAQLRGGGRCLRLDHADDVEDAQAFELEG